MCLVGAPKTGFDNAGTGRQLPKRFLKSNRLSNGIARIGLESLELRSRDEPKLALRVRYLRRLREKEDRNRNLVELVGEPLELPTLENFEIFTLAAVG